MQTNYCFSSSLSLSIVHTNSDSIRFSVYDGSYDPSLWIKSANSYFSFHHTPIGHKVDIASSYLQGRALDWFWCLLASRSSISWLEFVEELHSCFGSTTHATRDHTSFKSSPLPAAATTDFFGIDTQSWRDFQAGIDAAFTPLFEWVSAMESRTQQCANSVPASALETSPNSTVGSQVDDVYGQDWTMEEPFVIPGSATLASDDSLLRDLHKGHDFTKNGGDAHNQPGVFPSVCITQKLQEMDGKAILRPGNLGCQGIGIHDGFIGNSGVFILEVTNRPPGESVCAIFCAMPQASICRYFPVMSKPPPKPQPPMRPPPKPPWVFPRQALVKISRSMSHVGKMLQELPTLQDLPFNCGR